MINKFKYVGLHSNNNVITNLDFRVDDGIKVTNTKPDSFEFVGEIVKVNSWAELLTKFIGIAYDLNTELFVRLAKNDYSIPNANNIYISNDSRKLRRYKQIDNSGIYFEKNLSASSILSFIRDLLIQMNLDTDDFSFSLAGISPDKNEEN